MAKRATGDTREDRTADMVAGAEVTAGWAVGAGAAAGAGAGAAGLGAIPSSNSLGRIILA